MNTEKPAATELTAKQQDYVEIENTCCLCGTELVFEHNQDETASLVTEKAQCPCCKVMMKEKEFTIH